MPLGKRQDRVQWEALSGAILRADQPAILFRLEGGHDRRGFHWQRQEDQRFKGALNLVATDKGIVTINQVDVEEYLTSVISSGDERQRFQRVAESPCRDLAKLALGTGREEFQLERIGYAL